MNSFLTAKVFQLSIDSYEDVLKSHNALILKAQLFEEDLFKQAPEGSVLRKIYNKKLQGTKRYDDYDGLDEIIDLVKADKAHYFYSIETLMRRPEYPCDIIDVKALT